MHKEVVMHTHFNHPDEMTGVTQDAMDLLMERGVTVRNQAVLQRGVNDDTQTMKQTGEAVEFPEHTTLLCVLPRSGAGGGGPEDNAARRS